MAWYERVFTIEELGNVLPYTGTIPREVLLGNLKDVVDFIIFNIENEKPIPSTVKIYSMIKFPSFLEIPITIIQLSFFQRRGIDRRVKETKAYY